MNDASKPRTHLLHLTKHPTLQSQYAGREWRPFHVRSTMDNGPGPSVLLPDHSLRCETVKSTRRRGGVHERDDINTTSLRPPTTQNAFHHSQHRTRLKHIRLPHQRRVDTLTITSRASRNTRHHNPSTRERVASLSCTPMDGRRTLALRLPARPQFTAWEIEDYT